MVECPFCHTTHVYNTIFCNECGTYLLDEENSSTDTFDTDELRWIGDNGPALKNSWSAPSDVEPLAVRMKIGPRGRQVEMPLNKIIHVGRMDPAFSVLPEIDLSEDDIATKGVSRRHARIIKQGKNVVVEDLGSINGTFINGERLAAYLPMPLTNGDVLQLGKVLIQVEILPMAQPA